jgi:hypothetical protein
MNVIEFSLSLSLKKRTMNSSKAVVIKRGNRMEAH